jgi:hypothetical protein
LSTKLLRRNPDIPAEPAAQEKRIDVVPYTGAGGNVIMLAIAESGG